MIKPNQLTPKMKRHKTTLTALNVYYRESDYLTNHLTFRLSSVHLDLLEWAVKIDRQEIPVLKPKY
jgi:hypothetical protein